MVRKIQFDDKRARSYRKRTEVLAFQSDGAMIFQKPWGKQEVRTGGWVIVPLTEAGEATQDVYGCDAEIFAKTYEASPSLRPNRYRKTELVQAYQPGKEFEVDTRLPDGHVEVKSSRAGSSDTWIVRAKSGEMYPIEDAEFRRTYVEEVVRSGPYRVKTRDEHWAADGTPKRILALDGGGVRGILTIGYLERIEKILGERYGDPEGFRLCHYFDLIAGTSTGAILAACLAKGMQVSDIRKLYEELAPSVFERSFFRKGYFRVRYSSGRLNELMKKHFRNNTLGSKALQTGLLVVAKRLDTGSTWPMSNNPRNPFYTAKPSDTFLSNEDYPLRVVVRASTAAPSYFAPEYIDIEAESALPSKEGRKPTRGEFVDGGVSPHNNPALIALQFATLNGFKVGWPLDPDKLLLVSLGTGIGNPGVSRSVIPALHAVNSLRSLMNDCALSIETQLQWLSKSPTARSVDAVMQDLDKDLLAERPLLQYLRYNAILEGPWLENQLGIRVSEGDLKSLREMDRPECLARLSEIGVSSAQKQILAEHFPAGFDLGS